MASRIEYSEKYQDDSFEYRHVILPKDLAKGLPKSRVLSEQEWRGLGVQQSRGWMHYAIHRLGIKLSGETQENAYAKAINEYGTSEHRYQTGKKPSPRRNYPPSKPEPHILLFKRPLGTDPVSGKVDPALEREAKKAYQQELAGKMDPGSQVAPMAM